LPGFCLAYATSDFMSVAGTPGLTAKTKLASASRATGAKSDTASNGIFL
jgi:hypothetical protein